MATGGAQLGEPDTASVTITDNDTSGSVVLSVECRSINKRQRRTTRASAKTRHIVGVEGDANDDNCTTILDFSIFIDTFGKCESDTGFDTRSDFNQDSCITSRDFSLLATNFGQCGASNPSMMVSPLMATSNGTVVMSVVPSTSIPIGRL